jgi:protein O-GlcNAc transferase
VALALPDRADVLLLMGAIHYQLKNFDQCISFNDRAILLDPTMAEAHANLANALQQLNNTGGGGGGRVGPEGGSGLGSAS